MVAAALPPPVAPVADDPRRIPGNKGIWVGITCVFVEFVVLFALWLYAIVRLMTGQRSGSGAAEAKARGAALDRAINDG